MTTETTVRTGAFGEPIAKTRRFRNAHWPRYVFIHINKTAGSSIERALDLRFEHKTAIEKRRELGEWRWRRAFKFSFVRNPWDKVLSHYNYRVATNQTGMGDRHISFHDWVLRAYGDRDPRYYDQPRMFMPQCAWLTDERGEMIVDLVGRFESLEDDFARICNLLGVHPTLPHLKPSTHAHYSAMYDAESRDCVARTFASDVAKFRYMF